MHPTTKHLGLGRVVRKPVNANTGLKVNRSSKFFLDKNVFCCLCFELFELSQAQNRRANSISHMCGVKIQIFEKGLHMKLYPVLHCGQVKVCRKVNFSSLVTTMYLGGVPKVCNWFCYSEQ